MTITLQTAFLANSASMEASGLVSVLGAFINQLNGPQLPIRSQLWVVARLDVEEVDTSLPHTLVVTVDHSDGTEQLARVEGTLPPAAVGPEIDSDLPIGAPLVIPLFLEFRRLGVYMFRLAVDGEMLWEGPVKVRTLLPQI